MELLLLLLLLSIRWSALYSVWPDHIWQRCTLCDDATLLLGINWCLFDQCRLFLTLPYLVRPGICAFDIWNAKRLDNDTAISFITFSSVGKAGASDSEKWREGDRKRERERESQISNSRNRHGSISHLKRVECAIRTHAHLYELNRNSIQFRENREKLQIN